jgi:hypothetical protein
VANTSGGGRPSGSTEEALVFPACATVGMQGETESFLGSGGAGVGVVCARPWHYAQAPGYAHGGLGVSHRVLTRLSPGRCSCMPPTAVAQAPTVSPQHDVVLPRRRQTSRRLGESRPRASSQPRKKSLPQTAHVSVRSLSGRRVVCDRRANQWRRHGPRMPRASLICTLHYVSVLSKRSPVLERSPCLSSARGSHSFTIDQVIPFTTTNQVRLDTRSTTLL